MGKIKKACKFSFGEHCRLEQNYSDDRQYFITA